VGTGRKARRGEEVRHGDSLRVIKTEEGVKRRIQCEGGKKQKQSSVCRVDRGTIEKRDRGELGNRVYLGAPLLLRDYRMGIG